MRALVLLILAALAVAAVAAVEHQRPNDGLPVVQADYPLCVTVSPPPLVPKARGIMPTNNSELS